MLQAMVTHEEESGVQWVQPTATHSSAQQGHRPRRTASADKQGQMLCESRGSVWAIRSAAAAGAFSCKDSLTLYLCRLLT